jgi:hypothetical protein
MGGALLGDPNYCLLPVIWPLLLGRCPPLPCVAPCVQLQHHVAPGTPISAPRWPPSLACMAALACLPAPLSPGSKLAARRILGFGRSWPYKPALWPKNATHPGEAVVVGCACNRSSDLSCVLLHMHEAVIRKARPQEEQAKQAKKRRSAAEQVA